MSTQFLQGCSWLHMLQIKNTTNENWLVEYKIKDERGIINNQVYNISEGEEINLHKRLDTKIIKFEIMPGQIVKIGSARNSHYKVYKQYSKFDEETPWKAFINVDRIRVYNEDESIILEANQLDVVLSKNSRSIARIDLSKALEQFKIDEP